jgi:predicted permease
MDTFLQDLRYAARRLVRAPGFTMVAVATLALGIGANTALFTLADSILSRPLPGVNGSDRLAWVTPISTRGGHPLHMSYPAFLAFREQSAVFSDLVAMNDAQFSIASGDTPERVRGQVVSGGFFSLLGAPMALGRGFLPAEDSTPLTQPVAVIGFDLWQRRFGADPSILGTRLIVNGQPFTIVGVAGERFNGVDHAERRDLWVPMMMAPRVYPQWRDVLGARGTWWLRAIGRLRPGITIARADAALAVVAAQLAKSDSALFGDLTARTYPVESGMTPGDGQDVYPVATLAAAVTLLVLLIACFNVSNLLISRGVARRREIGVRLSLGAARQRVVRQLLTESLLLAALGTAAGLMLAMWGTDLIARQIPAPLDLSPDRAVLGVALLFAVGTGLLFGLVPALHATRSDLASAVREGLIGVDVRRSRLQNGFVVAQIALSLVLLMTSGMFLRGLYKASRLDIGFEATRRVVALSFDLGLQGYTPERSNAFLGILGRRAAGLPGVESIAFTSQVPLGERNIGIEVSLEGGTTPAPDVERDDSRLGLESYEHVIRPGYFATIGLPIVRGRDFTTADNPGGPHVAIVSEQLARRAWPDQDPIGKRLSINGAEGPFLVVVGVAREALLAGTQERARPIVYLPQLQLPETMALTLLVRAGGDAAPLASALRREISALDRDLPVYGVQTLAQYRSDRLAEFRLGSSLIATFGALALLLATIGLYAVVAFAVGQRTREIGIRVALGALERQVIGLFVGQGARLTALGVGIGLLLSVLVVKLLSSLFLGLTLADVPTMLGVAALLATVSLCASWLPARRAAKVDPLQALRSE